MSSSDLKAGVFVKVLAGPYKDTVGVIEDIQDECSVVRIGNREGNAFALLDDLKVLPSIDLPEGAVPAMPKPSRPPLRRK